MKEHFALTPSLIVQRYKFYTRSRHQGESGPVCIQLRAITEFRRFGNGKQEALEENLRDRLVSGICYEKIKAKLLVETDPLTYKKAMSIAQSMETAAKNIKELQKTSPSGEPSSAEKQPVNKVQ